LWGVREFSTADTPYCAPTLTGGAFDPYVVPPCRRSLNSSEFKLRLSEFHIIFKRLFTIKEGTTIAKALLTIYEIRRRLRSKIDVAVK